jgi:hypothetical protein
MLVHRCPGSWFSRTDVDQRIMETKRNRRFAGSTENPFKSPSFSWTILAIFVLTILNAMDSAEAFPRFLPDQYATGSDPTFWGHLAAKGNEKGWDVVESVSEKGTLDRYAKSLVLILGRIVAIQSLASLISANENAIYNEVRGCMVRETVALRQLTHSLSTCCSPPCPASVKIDE